MYKYIVLDFGKVIVTPTTGNWDITPTFLKLIDIEKIDKKKYLKYRKKYGYILSEKVKTLEEEYDMFFRFYSSILKKSDPNYNEEIVKKIAHDRTYKNDKYTLYNTITSELKKLKKKSKLLLLTDSWPCTLNYLKENNLLNYFDKIYISSFYGVEKKDKVLFDYPIKDFNIKKGQALFIDDNELNLDNAKEKGFDVLLIDREKIVNKSKYKIINSLLEIDKRGDKHELLK